jgi:predicted nucleic acid-binding Zn ribbon protein
MSREGNSSRGGRIERIDDLLRPALERLGPKGVWTETKLRKVWQEVVGDQVHPHAHVRRLRGKTLEVTVDSDAWATELTYLAAALIERLNRRLGPDTVAEISVRKSRRARR